MRCKQDKYKVLLDAAELRSYVIAPSEKYSLETTFERGQRRWRRDRVR